jgi:hypothetical protein
MNGNDFSVASGASSGLETHEEKMVSGGSQSGSTSEGDEPSFSKSDTRETRQTELVQSSEVVLFCFMLAVVTQ